MAGWTVDESEGMLDLNEGELVLPAPWCKVLNLPDLWVPDGAERGESVIIAGVAGRKSRPRRYDESTWSLGLIVRGDVTWDDETPGSVAEGMFVNVAKLRSETAPVDSDPGTRLLTLTTPDGDTHDAEVYASLIGEENALRHARFALRITCPAGPIVP
jgi:hypothetical protein